MITEVMQFETRIDKSNHLRVHTLAGQFGIDSLIGSLTQFYNSSAYDPDMNVLWDLRQIEGLGALATPDINKLVSLVSRRWISQQPRRAALVVARLVDFGLARMYEMRMESVSKQEIRVFTNINEAAEWLGITEELP
jgi:hypothetical protein